MSEQNTPSPEELLCVTWQSFQDQIEALEQLENDTFLYRHKAVSKVLFLGSVWGFLLHAIRHDAEHRYHMGSIDALINARFEVTQQVVFCCGKAAPCAAVAIFQAYLDIEYLFEVWPGLVDWCCELSDALKRNFPKKRNKNEEVNPQERVAHLVQVDECFHHATHSFAARPLSRSLKVAFQDINISYLNASATQEYTYALKSLRLGNRDEAGSVNMPKSKEKKECEAVRRLIENPTMSAVELAREIGCSRGALYTWPRVRSILNARKSSRDHIPRGFRTSDGKLEAFE